MPEQLHDFAVNIFGLAMNDLSQPREDFEKVVARNKHQMLWQQALTANPDHTNPFGRPSISPRCDIQAEHNLSNDKARYLIVGYALPKITPFDTLSHRTQKFNGDFVPSKIRLAWVEPVVYVVTEILQQAAMHQAMPTLYALILPIDGVWTPHRISHENVFFRYEFRTFVRNPHHLVSAWGSLVFQKCAQLSQEHVQVMSSEPHGDLVQHNGKHGQATIKIEDVSSKQNNTIVEIEDDDDNIGPKQNEPGHQPAIHETVGLEEPEGLVHRTNSTENGLSRKRALTRQDTPATHADIAQMNNTLPTTQASPTEAPSSKRLRTPTPTPTPSPTTEQSLITNLPTQSGPKPLSADAQAVTRRARAVLLNELRTRNTQTITYMGSALRTTVAALRTLLDEDDLMGGEMNE